MGHSITGYAYLALRQFQYFSRNALALWLLLAAPMVYGTQVSVSDAECDCTREVNTCAVDAEVQSWFIEDDISDRNNELRFTVTISAAPATEPCMYTKVAVKNTGNLHGNLIGGSVLYERLIKNGRPVTISERVPQRTKPAKMPELDYSAVAKSCVVCASRAEKKKEEQQQSQKEPDPFDGLASNDESGSQFSFDDLEPSGSQPSLSFEQLSPTAANSDQSDCAAYWDGPDSLDTMNEQHKLGELCVLYGRIDDMCNCVARKNSCAGTHASQFPNTQSQYLQHENSYYSRSDTLCDNMDIFARKRQRYNTMSGILNAIDVSNAMLARLNSEEQDFLNKIADLRNYEYQVAQREAEERARQEHERQRQLALQQQQMEEQARREQQARNESDLNMALGILNMGLNIANARNGGGYTPPSIPNLPSTSVSRNTSSCQRPNCSAGCGGGTRYYGSGCEQYCDYGPGKSGVDICGCSCAWACPHDNPGCCPNGEKSC